MPEQLTNISTIPPEVAQLVTQLLRSQTQQADTATTALSDYSPNNGDDSLLTTIAMGAAYGLLMAVIGYFWYLGIRSNCCGRDTPSRASLLSANRDSNSDPLPTRYTITCKCVIPGIG